MRILSVLFENFRNYKKRSFTFNSGLSILLGDNASGKTNLLEGIYLLASGRSFRAQKIEEMIFYKEELSRVVGVIKAKEKEILTQETSIEVLLTKGELQGKRVAKRRYSIDGLAKRAYDFVGRLVVVLFRPEDLEIIIGSPSIRRQFLDNVLLQIDREYRRSLDAYEKALSRRNRILDMIRDQGAPRTQLAFWDQLLIKHGNVISEKRKGFLDFVNSYQSEVDSYQTDYKSSIISGSRLKQYAQQEIAAGFTLVGPHKDDFRVDTRNKSKKNTTEEPDQMASGQEKRDIALYGSRGEQRLAVLWLKLAELAFVQTRIGEEPVLLLDDIFSELDKEHRLMVLKVVPRHQTIVTTTDISLIEFKKDNQYSVIEI